MAAWGSSSPIRVALAGDSTCRRRSHGPSRSSRNRGPSNPSCGWQRGVDRRITNLYPQKTGLALSGPGTSRGTHPRARRERVRFLESLAVTSASASSAACAHAARASDHRRIPSAARRRGRGRSRQPAVDDDARGHAGGDGALSALESTALRTVVHGVLMDILGLGVRSSQKGSARASARWTWSARHRLRPTRWWI
jgi:hypothetical protein